MGTKRSWRVRVARIVGRHHEIHVRLLDESLSLHQQEDNLRYAYVQHVNKPPDVAAELERLSIRRGHIWCRRKHHGTRLKRPSIAWMINDHYKAIEKAEKAEMKARVRAIEKEQKRAEKARRKMETIAHPEGKPL